MDTDLSNQPGPLQFWVEVSYEGELIIVDVTVENGRITKWEIDKLVHPILTRLIYSLDSVTKESYLNHIKAKLDDLFKNHLSTFHETLP